MHLVKMVEKEGLVGKPQPIRKAEEGGADHHRTRADREKGAAKEEAAREPSMEAVKATGEAKELLVLELIEMAKPLETRVDKAPLKAWLYKAATESTKAATESTKAATESTHAAVESSMKAAKSSHAMGPGRCGRNPQGENDKPDKYAFLHGFALLSLLFFSAARANKKGQPLTQMALRQRLLRIHAPCRPASPPTAERHTPLAAWKSRAFDLLCARFPPRA